MSSYSAGPGTPSRAMSFLAPVGALASVGVLAIGLLYPLTSTIPRLDLRFPGYPAPTTLDALDWMRYGTLTTDTDGTITFNEDLDVINWFNEEIDGAPVIVEASIGPYRGNGSRISIATGLPTVIGWDRHERQQRATPGIIRTSGRCERDLQLYRPSPEIRPPATVWCRICGRWRYRAIHASTRQRATICKCGGPRDL